MHDPKLFSQKFLLTWLLTALFAVSLGALPVQAQPFADVANTGDNTVSVIDVAMNPIKSNLTLKFKMEARSDPGPITVELRGATAPYALIDSVKGTGGGNTASVISFEKAAGEVPYYIVIKSENSIETWSATTITFKSNAASYDFTTNVSQAYGNNQKLASDGIASIYQGDVDQNGFVDLTDLIVVQNASSSFATTPATDINNDGETNLTDLIVTYNNSTNFVEVKRP